MPKYLLTFVLFLVGAFTPLRAQLKQYQFDKIDISKGLSNNQVTSMLRDSKGFMWFGTTYGLNRFDGAAVRPFLHSTQDSTSLPNNTIQQIFEGPDQLLWVQTLAGFTVYNPKTEGFYQDLQPLLKQYGLPSGGMRACVREQGGAYWFVTSRAGLSLYQGPNQKNLRLVHQPADTSSLHSNLVTSLTLDANGNLWVIHRDGVFEKIDRQTLRVVYRNRTLQTWPRGTPPSYALFLDREQDLWVYARDQGKGVYLLDAGRTKLRHIHKQSAGLRLNADQVGGVVQDDQGLIWVGTDKGGISLLDKKAETSRYLVQSLDGQRSLSNNNVRALYRDHAGIIWVGTYQRGVNFYHQSIAKFSLFRNVAADQSSLPYTDMGRLAEDAQGNLWLGTNGGGLIYHDRQTNQYRQYLHDPKDPNSLSNNVIVSLCVDHQGILWVGTYHGGLNRFDGSRFTRFRHDPTDPQSLSDDSVWEIYEDSRRNLWIGTLSKGLERFDREQGVFHHYTNGGDSGRRNSIHADYVSHITEDRAGHLWVGTGYGIEVLNPETGRFTHYINNPTDPHSLSNRNVNWVMQDSRGWMWVGTQEGLNLFDPKEKKFRVFREEDGLAGNVIVSVLEDNQGSMWVGTSNGLSNVLVGKESNTGRPPFHFRNYGESDGLQGKEFGDRAALKTRRGELLFGGPNGLNLIKPTDIVVNKTVPRIVFTDFQLFSRRVAVGETINGRVLLPNALDNVGQVTLKPGENVFSIEFAALSFLQANKNKYLYRLEGFDDRWMKAAENQRKATYTSLNPGHYTFRVKAANSDGYWNEEGISLKLTVLPPFWKTNFALAAYCCLLFGAIAVGRGIVLERVRNKLLIKQQRQETQRMHELDVLKIKFFTNVSHEFRTPLTLILAPLETLITQTREADKKKQFVLIHRNARRLLNLVNQLLDFRKMEVQELRLTPTEGDVISFVKEVVYGFSDISEKKKIQFTFHTDLANLQTFFDHDKLEKILFNLLSNAFKFTPENGLVTVELCVSEKGEDPEIKKEWLEIKVRDNGIGIPVEKQQLIFERFFQHATTGTVLNQGSGLGLALTKEFARLHGGWIWLESKPGKGSCFTVTLPLHAAAAKMKAPWALSEIVQTRELLEEEGAQLMGTAALGKKPVVLLAEDNEDFRFYLKDNLKAHFRILEASHGKHAWQQALNLVPDLIVSDIMMPEMDGISLCRQLKKDPRTSHIPVILLTARATDEQKVEGFEAGTNEYITKPFNFDILLSRIRALITQQEILRRSFQNNMEVSPSQISITSLDEKLLLKTISLVQDNLVNPEFSVEVLSRELGMSRVQLYRKLLSLTGKSPLEFIRLIRLRRAAELLEQSKLSVSEIAYEVGFNNPKYFTKYFKTEFNVLPSLYAAMKQKA